MYQPNSCPLPPVMQVHFSCDDVPADLLTAKFSRLQTRGFHGHSVRFSYANEKVCRFLGVKSNNKSNRGIILDL